MKMELKEEKFYWLRTENGSSKLFDNKNEAIDIFGEQANTEEDIDNMELFEMDISNQEELSAKPVSYKELLKAALNK